MMLNKLSNSSTMNGDKKISTKNKKNPKSMGYHSFLKNFKSNMLNNGRISKNQKILKSHKFNKALIAST